MGERKSKGKGKVKVEVEVEVVVRGYQGEVAAAREGDAGVCLLMGA